MIYNNQTRISASIPRALIEKRKFHLLPFYYLLLTSELANEGIHNGGSYKFADRIYKNKPRGRYLIGYILDSLFLHLNSAKAFKYRYDIVKFILVRYTNDKKEYKNSMAISSIPSGYAREIVEVIKEYDLIKYNKFKYYLFDLDQELLNKLKRYYETLGINLIQGNALEEGAYTKIPNQDVIISMGFTEFLDDETTLKFYSHVHSKIKSDGLFITSGMMPTKLSEYLLRNFAELKTHYRTKQEMINLGEKVGFKISKIYQNKNKLQTVIVWRKKK